MEASGLNAKVLAASILGMVVVIGAIVGIGTGLFALPHGDGSSYSGNGEISTFQETGTEIETIDGKPVIRLFSTTGCPHCIWIKETFDKVAKEYVSQGKIVAFHWELDVMDDTLTEDFEGVIPAEEYGVFISYNPDGYVPLFVFGGKYARLGNGYESQNDLLAEEAEFRAAIEKLLQELETKQ